MSCNSLVTRASPACINLRGKEASAFKGAFKATSTLAGKSDSVRINIGNGGVAFYNHKTPTSVYLAYPHVDLQIEVYDPKPGRAEQLVVAGQLVAIR